MSGARRNVLLITGGSRGIGAATARLAAQRGFVVAVNYYQSHEAAEQLARGIEASGGRAQAFAADVADPVAVERLFALVDQSLGPLSALVNCAGISGGACGIAEIPSEQLQRVIAVNLLGVFYCVRAAVHRMAKSRGGAGGAIVNLSSESGKFGGNRLSAYAAAKAGVNALTVGVARELAAEGIRLNAVSPGVIDTEQHAGVSAERRATLLASLPMARMGRADEVAEAILWLLSDAASYISGAILPVTGAR